MCLLDVGLYIWSVTVCIPGCRPLCACMGDESRRGGDPGVNGNAAYLQRNKTLVIPPDAFINLNVLQFESTFLHFLGKEMLT